VGGEEEGEGEGGGRRRGRRLIVPGGISFRCDRESVNNKHNFTMRKKENASNLKNKFTKKKITQ